MFLPEKNNKAGEKGKLQPASENLLTLCKGRQKLQEQQ